MKKNEVKVTFGDKFCLYCELAVAEHINGRYVVLQNQLKGYLHDGCMEKVIKGACR
jgi:hypothetical protein